MSAITITISSPGRAIVADGRLVAGESADVSVVGGVPAALYLVDATRDVVAACTSFVAGESSATGELNLATVPLAEIVDEIPAGRAIPLQAILEDAAGAVIGYGLVAVVSAPMPDALDPLDEDLIYAKLSDLRDYLTRAEADERYASADAAVLSVNGVTPTDGDVSITGVQIAFGPGVDESITSKINDVADAAVLSVNGVTPTAGAVTITGADIETAGGSGYSVLDAIANIVQDMEAIRGNLRYAQGATITASAQLADRTGNRVVPPADNTADIVLTFPDAVTGYLRDFEILVTNTVGNTGNITFTPPTGATVYGDGFTHSPASGETWLYVVSEATANVFWCKAEKMEVAQ